jgi:hypothetical protein
LERKGRTYGSPKPNHERNENIDPIRYAIECPGQDSRRTFGNYEVSRLRAKQSVWWPGLSTQIQDMVQHCRTCAMHMVNKPEPLFPIYTSFPERPWQTLAIDFFKCENIDYLIVVDYFSRYVEICPMKKNKTATEVCRVLKSIFSK